MKQFNLILIFLCISICCTGQADIAWDLILGGSGDEKAFDLIHTLDGGFLVVGYTTSSNNGDVHGSNRGDKDYWIVRLDNTSPPVVLWEKNYGGIKKDIAYRAIQDKESQNFIVIGKTNSGKSGDIRFDSIGGFDYWMIELDNMTGNIIRDTLFGTEGADDNNSINSDEDNQIDILRSKDKNYLMILCNQTVFPTISPYHIDAWWLKWNWQTWKQVPNYNEHYDLDGAMIGNEYYSLSSAMCEMDDSTILLASYISNTLQNQKDDFWLLKINPNGGYVMDSTFGGTSAEWPRDMIIDQQGNILIIGNSSSTDGDVGGVQNNFDNKPGDDCWVLKLDKNFNILWEKNYGGNWIDVGYCIRQAKDGGYYLGGKSLSARNSGDICTTGAYGDYFLLKIDSLGTLEWSSTEEHLGGESIYAMDLVNDMPVVAGFTETPISPTQSTFDIWLVQYQIKDCNSPDPLKKPMLSMIPQGDSIKIYIVDPLNYPGIRFRWISEQEDSTYEQSWILVSPTDTQHFVARYRYNCCFSLPSDTIRVHYDPPPPPVFHLPDHPVITPNDDGINDTWKIEGLPNGSMLSIYNRWGACVWVSSDDKPDWSGVGQDGKPLPEGYYRFKLVVPDSKKVHTGYVKILK